MLILLAPSETKSPPPTRGRTLDLDGLSFPELGETRSRVLDAVATTSARPDALARLMVGGSLAGEIERNTRLASLPTRRALDTYTGVAFDALGATSLSTAAKQRAARSLVMLSGLWGATRPGDRIPAYRLNICSDLVGLGGLESLWRGILPDVLAGAAGPRGLVLDCRSSSYQAMGKPTGLARRTITVRVVRPGEGRAAPSYVAKQTRGHLVRWVLESGINPRTPAGLAAALEVDWKLELIEPPRAEQAWTMHVGPLE